MMPITEVRIQNFRAFADSGVLNFSPMTAIVGQNDVGKSGILYALRAFFEPPRRGGLSLTDLHKQDRDIWATIEIAFRPDKLQTREVQVDARNKIDIIEDHLVDEKGLLRLRISLSKDRVEAFQTLIHDVDDPDLFPLALKRQRDLLGLLEARSLPAVRAGRETNKEKRDTLRDYALQNDFQYQEEWVDASSITTPLRDILPRFVFFTDTAAYDVGTTGVQNQFRGVVDRALENHPNAQQLEDDIRCTIQAEFDRVYGHLQGLTDSVTSMKANPQVSWRKAVDGIGLVWKDKAGVEVPYESRGAGVRRLFMVAYLQYEATESLRAPDGPRYVFAIEEPEVHLHPGAQRTLLEALKDLGELGHSVVFTTHSPVFVASAPAESLIMIARPGDASEAAQVPALEIQQVAKELGILASDRLIGKNCVVLVEGKDDVEFFEVVLDELFTAGHIRLDPKEVLFLQCGGLANVEFVASVESMKQLGFPWAVIIDSDRLHKDKPPSDDSEKARTTVSTTDSCVCCHQLTRSSIENYFDPEVAKAVANIGHNILPDRRITLTGKPLKRLKSKAGEIAREMGADRLIECSKNEDGNSEWEILFERLWQAFGLD
jgi:putative ATP-dependent endonuclease of OLD family